MTGTQPLVALTGGSGFLGSHIADTLLASGQRVRVAVRATSNLRWLESKPLEIVVVDLADRKSCMEFLRGTSGLVHCAGVVAGPDEASYQEGNVTPTVKLLQAAHEVWGDDPTTVFLLISSLAAHGPASLQKPAVEDDPCRPLTAYGRSKRDAEIAVLAADVAFRRLILRPPSLYGPRDREFLPLLKVATQGWTVRLGQRMTGLSLVDGRDVAAAVQALLANETVEGTYFIADAQTGYDWDQMRAALSSATGRKVRRIQIPLAVVRLVANVAGFIGSLLNRPTSLLLGPDRIRDLDSVGWVCDGGKLTRETGFIADRNAATGFTETLAYYRKQGWL